MYMMHGMDVTEAMYCLVYVKIIAQNNDLS